LARRCGKAGAVARHGRSARAALCVAMRRRGNCRDGGAFAQKAAKLRVLSSFDVGRN